MNQELDRPDRIISIRQLIEKKAGLKAFYDSVYSAYSASILDFKSNDVVVELGAGGSFYKEICPSIIATDIIPYPGLDLIVDACSMPFKDGEVSAFLLSNVLHHIPDAEKFFFESQRCLKPGGKMVIFDQFPGYISKPLLKHLHHEGFDEVSKDWHFQSSGPLSSANGALPWKIFFRDIKIFEKKFPHLKIIKITPKAPLLYWLSGGLKKWSLAPKCLLALILFIDRTLLRINKKFGSFILIEIEKK
jgi:SAM-dependent methyltransferase